MNLNFLNVSVFGGTNVGTSSLLEKLKRQWWSIRHKNDRIRFSISALVRIQIDDQYLLVMGNRVPKFQPVGGVLKFYPDAFKDLESCGMQADNMFCPDKDNQDDLRLLIPGQRLPDFLSWYESGKERERDPWREFCEELITTGLLDAATFPYARFQYLGQKRMGIERSDHIQGYECRIAEIFKLVPTKTQVTALRRLIEEEPTQDRYTWATAETIRSQGIIPKQQTTANISDTAQWILQTP
ncbi:MAG: hypothetical protein KDN22_16900 [Verrucomicrobiae bacterium]|nr:hypothetical protein [Verrucomicrobiae bacterium]